MLKAPKIKKQENYKISKQIEKNLNSMKINIKKLKHNSLFPLKINEKSKRKKCLLLCICKDMYVDVIDIYYYYY